MKRLHLLASVLLLVAAASATPAEQPAITPAGPIEGALVIHGGGPLPDAVAAEFVRLAGGESARLVVIPTAGAGEVDDAKRRRLIDAWTKRGISDVTILHTRDRAQSDDEAFTAPLRRATAVWFEGGLQARLESAYVGTGVERELHALLRRGGVIGGTSAGAAVMSRVMIRQGQPVAEVGTGLGLIPGCVIDQHFVARDRQPRLVAVLGERPGLFGLGIDESTAIVLRGREIRVVGESQVVVCFSPSKARPARTITLSGGDRADLIQLSRAAIDRAGELFPPAQPAPPTIENGTLVIVGGGGLPPEAVKRFVDAAGGADAKIVIVPTAAGPDPAPPRTLIGMLESLGVKDVHILHAADAEAARDPALLEKLKDATGVWFGGGRQWRLLDAFEKTPIVAAFHEVLRRGGVIGGSSAGATIQGEYLVRGHPLGNQVMMAEGYERGFAFLPGTAIDQHFTQRHRFDDLAAVKQAFPQLLCLGIDESTAVIVTRNGMEVVGKHHVYVFDGAAEGNDTDAVEPPFKKLGPGERYIQSRANSE